MLEIMVVMLLPLAMEHIIYLILITVVGRLRILMGYINLRFQLVAIIKLILRLHFKIVPLFLMAFLS